MLYLYCHPLPESFHAAIRVKALEGLAQAGHEVDMADLYAEGFDPVISAQHRRDYHDLDRNRIGIEDHVRRLHAAEVLLLQFPVWSFGPPAMLKGWMDHLLKPGVAFDLSDPSRVKPMLQNLRHVVGITTYGRPWWNAFGVGDPPKKIVTRYLPRFSGGSAKVSYYPLYHMNVASEAKRIAFMEKVRAAMARL